MTTGETVWRDTPQPGAVLTRVASASYIRVGTFQFFAARGDVDAVRQLADYAIARHYPEAADAPNPIRAFLDLVIARQAELVAQWLLVGFIHGVMNTDNMSVAGETIDNGPCAFMDAYDPATVFSSIDQTGRYAYGNQPGIAHWNLARLAEALLPLLAEDADAALKEANEALDMFSDRFQTAYAAGLCGKIGLFDTRPEDFALAQDLLERMARNQADFTLTFRGLCDAAAGEHSRTMSLRAPCSPIRGAFDEWAQRWRQRLADDDGDANERKARMLAKINPAFIARNHLVEEIIAAAVDHGDFAPFETLLTVLSRPYDDQPEFRRYAEPPRPDQIVHQTFCGT